MRKFFLDKLYAKWGGPFHKKLKLSISLDQQCEMLNRLILLFFKWKYVKTKVLTLVPSLLLLKNKKRLGTSLSASFSAWFLKKNISQVIFYQLTKSDFLVAFTSKYIERYVYCNYLSGYDGINCKISGIFLTKSFFYMNKKSGQKFKYFRNKKSC